VKAVLSIDWLAFYGIVQNSEELMPHMGAYTLRLEERGTRQFRNLYTITKDNEEIAYLQTAPYSKILDPKGCIIKFANRLLYSANLWSEIENVLACLAIEVQSISRLDICSDFHEFLDGYQCEDMIKDFLSQNIRKKGRASGTAGFRQTRDGMRFNALTFGTHESDTRVYLYNKTLELKEQTDKPYIRDTWAANGLDITRDVWRLEVSLKSKAMEMYNKDAGRKIKFTKDNLQERLRELYDTMVKALFTFVIPDNPNISRCTVIDLLPTDYAFNRAVVRNVTGSDRAEKILIKQLHFLTQKYRYFSTLDHIGEYVNADIIKNSMIEACDLKEWYRYKSKVWDTPSRKPN
jgi:hypothetical protein